ncbi:MAG: type II toxin-antitoxin system RelE/ParE family toxin [Terriglobia bacterium]
MRINPVSAELGARKLHGIRPAAYRVRVGSYRVIYTFDQTELILLRIRHRKDVYRNL